MKLDFKINSKVFNSVLNIDVVQLSKLSHSELRPILPCLVRMSLIAPFDPIPECNKKRKAILTIINNIDPVNSLVALLSIDFHGLEVEVKEEQNARKKSGVIESDSILHQSRRNTLALEFERSDSTKRLRLVLCELLFTGMQVQEFQKSNEFFMKSSDLFDNIIYIPEVCDVINIALAELPGLLTIQDVPEILLHVKHGPDIICCIAANFPDYFYDICVSLIANSERIEDDNGGTRIRMIALTSLCKMNPPAAYFVRSKCVELCKLAPLTITLTLDFPQCFPRTDNCGFLSRAGDIVSFVSGVLLGADQNVRNWFTLFTRTKPKVHKNKENINALQLLRDELIFQLKIMTGHCKDNKIPEFCVVYDCVLLKLYCALRGIAGIKFQDDEISLLIKLITAFPPATGSGVRLAAISVCMLFACPSLIADSQNEAKCIMWLRWLSRPDSSFFGKPTDVTTAFSEMLLLLAIHLHSNHLNSVCDLVCSTLGMKISIRTHNMSRIRAIFVQEVFTEKVVTSRAVKVLVTPKLSSNITGFLPLHCIHQLMKSNAFTKHKVNVKDWIYKQICASIAPLHPLLPPLIEIYVYSMLTPASKNSYESLSNEPITEEEIMCVLKNSSFANDADTGNSNLTPQLLLLYYVLLYEDVRLHSRENKNVKSYSLEFLHEFPIKYLLQQAQKSQRNYSSLLPPLLRLLLSHFPHLALVEDWIDEEISVPTILQKSMSNTTLASGLEQMAAYPSQASRLLNNLLTIAPTEMWQYVQTFVDGIRYTLDKGVPRYIQELYRRVWLRYNGLLPRRLWVMTINALSEEKSKFSSGLIGQQNIIIDPIQVLRCDVRVHRCPPILSILIRILQSSLAASRSQLTRHLLDRSYLYTMKDARLQASIQNEKYLSEREELKNALIAAQESVAIQILLEICIENEEDKVSQSTFWALSESRSLICVYVHQAFIADPSLAKLVHFQCYPRELLPVTVTGIPSMHICSTFIAELISQPSLEKQVFAISLISHLSLQYALPQSMMIARLVLNMLHELLAVLTPEPRTYVFTNSLPAIVRVCQAFPVLTEDAFLLLVDLGKLCLSEKSLNTGVLSDHFVDSKQSRGTDYKQIITTFEQILTTAILNTRIYSS